MTSKPSSRSPRARTLAPRSWPSSPGLAMSTLSGRSVTPPMIATGSRSAALESFDRFGHVEIGDVLGVVLVGVAGDDLRRPPVGLTKLRVGQALHLAAQPVEGRLHVFEHLASRPADGDPGHAG